MNLLMVLLANLALGGALAYLRKPLAVSTVAAAVGLLLIGRFAHGFFSDLLLLLVWAAWLGMLALNFPALRRRYFIEPLFALFKRELPTISQTEQDALDAGTVWWDAELFSGKPNWSRLLSLPAAKLRDDEQAFLDGPVEELCSMVDEWQISQTLGDLPAEAWQFIKRKGFLGMIIPRRYGGLEFSARGHSAVIQKIASRSGTAAVSVMVPNSLGPAELLLRYGTDEQKDHYLPRLARGEDLPCFALTNPFAGSDAASIPDRGIVCRGQYLGRDVLGIRLTWEKRYITLGPIATVLGLAFHLYDPEGLLGTQPNIGITLALLPTTHPGVEIGRRHFPAQQAFQNGPNSGTEVFIPIDWVIGGQSRCGDGWRMLMNCLAAGRSISLPGSSTAALKICARTAGAYARVRSQFNLPIGRFEGVQEALARIAGNTYLIDAARDVTAGVLDQGEEPAVLSALLKYQATERMRGSINDAMDIHGGRGVCDGPANYLLRAYTAVPVAITVEGANILTRSLIVFGQGAIRCHPWLLKEIAAAKDSDEARGLETFETAILGHIAGLLSNAARAAFANLTNGAFGSEPSTGAVNTWYKQLDRYSATFALVADCALLQLGGALKRKEKLSGRFADILGELYLLSCALKRFEDDGRPAQDLPLLDYVFHNGLFVVQSRLDEILQNFPSRALALGLRVAIFPWGRIWQPASDRLSGEVATLLIESRELRDRLARGTFFDTSPEDPIGSLEYAVELVVATEEVERKLRRAVRDGQLQSYDADLLGSAVRAGIISADEETQLRRMHAAVRRAIDVDDFDPAELWARRADDFHAVNAA